MSSMNSRNPVILLFSEQLDAALDAYSEEQTELNRYRVAVSSLRLMSTARRLEA